MRTLNAHRLLAGTALHPGYLDALDVGNSKERELRSARDQVRDALREGMRLLQEHGLATIVEQQFVAKAASLPPFRPRFRMQGSMKYRTLNEPAQKPPQEIDVDDGVYLPTSFVSGNGRVRPILASRAFFRAVEKILEPFCAGKGWTLDRSKPRCVRVRISGEAHIDLPLYAIPDDAFAQMAEDRALAKADSADWEFAELQYRALPTDQVMLACRDADWLPSDPRKIEDWFLEAIAEHGEVVRSVSRYLKGWRDFQLERCKLSSLLLMQCVVTVFDGLGGSLAPNRDDLALLAVTGKLAGLFADNIANPVLPEQSLNQDWSPTERAHFVGLAQTLHREMEGALNGTVHKGLAIRHFQAVFGSRIPDAPDLIGIDGKEEAVLAYGRAAVAAPAVPRTTSG